MMLVKTNKVVKQIGGVFGALDEPNDALLVSNIALAISVLRKEVTTLSAESMEPALLLELSKFSQIVGDNRQAISFFERAAAISDQNRGYYYNVGYCSVQLTKNIESEDFRLMVREAIQRLLEICPFPDDLNRGLGKQ